MNAFQASCHALSTISWCRLPSTVVAVLIVGFSITTGCLFAEEPFLRGDANADSNLDVSDGVQVLEFLFLGADALPCDDAGDMDDSGDLALNDAVFLFSALFIDGRAIPAPRESCGTDPTPDTLGCASFEPCAAEIAPTNVLLIISDDLGVDSSACYGTAGVASTPNLESLCATGVVFRNAWSYPVCSPTRASLLTGQYAFRTGIGDVIGSSSPFPLEALTLPRAFDASGPVQRAHACLGKWHLARRTDADHANEAGFSHYAGALNGLGDYYSWDKTVNGETAFVSQYATSENVDDAIEWIAQQGENPWFLWLAFNAPHTPFHLPPAALHGADNLSGSQDDIDADPVPYYQAAVEAMDAEIGRLLAAVDPAVFGRTNILYVGDNGSPSQLTEGTNRSRKKGSLYEGGIHVPLIVAGPSVVDGGREVDAVVQVTDLFATILELGGVDLDQVVAPDAPVDAVSLVPYLENPDQAALRSFVFSERFGDGVPANQAGRTIRDTRYKLIQFENGPAEFYNLEADPEEANDLLAAPPLTTEAAARFEALTGTLEGLLSE